jgi:hypothetical protein
MITQRGWWMRHGGTGQGNMAYSRTFTTFVYFFALNRIR